MIVWPEVELGNHIELVTGFPFKSARYLDGPTGAIRLLRGDNVAQGALRWDGAKHWPDAERGDYAEFELREDDIILAMDRPWIEAGLKYAWVRSLDLPCLLVQRVARMRGTNGLSTAFLRYIIGSSAFIGHVKSITTGVNVPHISGKDIKRFRFRLPPSNLQHRIVSILGAYDDLIEVNRRRIALLEELTRRLFEEWFVHFRFPGHEDVPLVPVGEARLPQGWSVKALGTLAAVSTDTIRPFSAPAWINYIDISSVSVGTVEKVETMPFNDAPGRARRRVKDGSIIWSMVRPNRRSYALLLDPAPDTVASTGFAVLDARVLPFAYLFHAVTTDAFVGYLTGHATGAAYPAVTGAIFERASIIVPPDHIAAGYAEVAEPMLRLASKLRAAKICLANSRDLLLPRLISGELSVTAAERELENAA